MHVALLGLGPSLSAYVDVVKRLGGRRAYSDEVWGINAVGDIVRCDRVFHMDDVAVQEARAGRRPESNIARMLDWMRHHPGPIVTSRVRPGYPGLTPFPLEAVLDGRYDGAGNGLPYFNSTAAYAVAFAIHRGVSRLSLFGIDYTLPDMHSGERGRACVEFWLGIAASRGMAVTVPETSTLLDACAPEDELLYGYDCVDVARHVDDDGRVRLSFTEKGVPPAAEIERRYDHGRHANRILAGDKQMKARALKAFPGVRDGHIHPETIAEGSEIDGALADIAVSGGLAEPIDEGEVEIPDGWADLHHTERKALAKTLTGRDFTKADEADAAIAAALDRRTTAAASAD